MDRDKSHRPRKRFGQHFLHDPRVVHRIVENFSPKQGESIVEIGPGLGSLTSALLTRVAALHAVELDRDLIEFLQYKYRSYEGFVIHRADALRFDYCSLAHGEQRLRIIGNLPYNISTPLLFYLFAQSNCIQDMCFMLQKEVVDRLCAAPGNKTYGRLSVMAQYHCYMEKLFDVGAGAFTPPPKVSSSVIKLIPHRHAPVSVNDYRNFSHVVEAAFSQRRKTLRNALKGLLDERSFQSANIDSDRRAETLTLAEFSALSNTIKSSYSR